MIPTTTNPMKVCTSILVALMLMMSSACSPEQRPQGADRFGEDRVVYLAPFNDVVNAASDALFNIGLTIEGGESLDESTVLINANKEHTAGTGANSIQVMSMQVFVHQLTGEMTEVRVRMEDSKRSGGLVGSGVASYPSRADYKSRLFNELGERYATAEVEEVPQQ